MRASLTEITPGVAASTELTTLFPRAMRHDRVATLARDENETVPRDDLFVAVFATGAIARHAPPRLPVSGLLPTTLPSQSDKYPRMTMTNFSFAFSVASFKTVRVSRSLWFSNNLLVVRMQCTNTNFALGFKSN